MDAGVIHGTGLKDFGSLFKSEIIIEEIPSIFNGEPTRLRGVHLFLQLFGEIDERESLQT